MSWIIRPASAHASLVPRTQTRRSLLPKDSAWIWMCARVCCWRKRMFSPPRPMTRPTFLCGTLRVVPYKAKSGWSSKASVEVERVEGGD
eukprot:31013-Pelagococcus_subviridis.AAC.5